MSLTSGIKINNSDLVLYLDVFNTPTWNIGRRVWRDISGQLNNATVVGSTLPQISNTEGYIQFLNGNNHHIEINALLKSDFAFGTGDFTIEAWVYPENFNTYTHIFCLGNQNTFALKANITNGRIYFTSTAFSTFNDITNWTLNLNQWNQVVLKRQSGIAHCYLNGVLIGTKTGFSNNIPGQLLAFVRNGGVAEYSQTRFKQILVYKRALSDVEIAIHHRVFSPRFYNPAVSRGTLTTVLNAPATSTVVGINIIPFVPVSASGGIGNLTYSISPAVPDGIIFNTTDGEISGLPTGTTNQTYTVTVRDALGTTQTRNFSLTVTVPPLIATRPTGTFNILVNSNISITPIIATGGFGAYTFSISPTTLPTGVTFNSGSGLISGTPTSLLGLTTYTITVQDSITPTPQSASVSIQLSVFPAALNIAVTDPVIIGNVGVAVNSTPVSASGGFGTLTYSIAPSLPSGLTLNASNGNITGTPSSGLSQTTFTIIVTDQGSQSANATFNLTVQSSLYTFTSFTFTNASATGPTGPTLSNCLSSYNTTTNPWLNNTAFFNVVTNGFQLWTAPQTGSYRITAVGAAGGQGTSGRGASARIIGVFNFTLGQKIKIAVGQLGLDGSNGCGNNRGGGGGGSFVTTEANAALIVAGGGGGGSASVNGTQFHATTTTTAQNGSDGGGTGGSGPSGAGGIFGGGCVPGGGGGGGFSTSGTSSTAPAAGGGHFTSGTPLQGGAGFSSQGAGGFGGGGGSSQYAGGGGGGFSGGGGGGIVSCNCSFLGAGGGAGSFNSGTSPNNSANFNSTTNGSVFIEKL